MDPSAATALARQIIDANRYMVLATSDGHGAPWASPVYFAPADYREFIWVSKPQARHSRNIAARPGVSIVIFDSTAPIGTGRGVYMEAAAGEVDPSQAPAALAAFSERSQAHGAAAWNPVDVSVPARLRLYRAVASAQWVLDERDERVAVELGALG